MASLKFHTIFSSFPLMRERIEAALLGKGDIAPGCTNSAILESVMVALVRGEPMSRYHAAELAPRVEEAMREVFALRDAGGFEKSQSEEVR